MSVLGQCKKGMAAAACRGCRRGLITCRVNGGAVQGGNGRCCLQRLQKSSWEVVSLEWRLQKK